MDKAKQEKKGAGRRALLILLYVLAVIPLFWIADSMLGRFDPSSYIPGSYIVRLHVPNPVRLIDGILSHESLPEIIRLPAFASASSRLTALQDNKLIRNPLLRFAARGTLAAVLLAQENDADIKNPGPFLAVWDAGFYAPLFRILPLFAQFISVPNLYYVQAGKYSRFEYRTEASQALFIKIRRNLLIICNDAPLFEQVMSGPNKAAALEAWSLDSADYDAMLMASPVFASGILSEQDPAIAAALQNLALADTVEAGISVSSRKFELLLSGKATSPVPALGRILGQPSRIPDLAGVLPAAAQYGTIFSAGTLAELYDAAAVFSGPELGENVREADRSSRVSLGLSLDDLLFSWTGTEFAVFGMEGRPHPVYAIQIANEQKRQEIFQPCF
jgi:hypothetical protein